MDKKTNEELQPFIDKATAGDKKALETLVTDAQDIVFNLSLRMLGTFADAEDATNDSLKTEYKLKAYFKQNITPCLTLLWQGVIFLEKYTLIS